MAISAQRDDRLRLIDHFDQGHGLVVITARTGGFEAHQAQKRIVPPPPCAGPPRSRRNAPGLRREGRCGHARHLRGCRAGCWSIGMPRRTSRPAARRPGYRKPKIWMIVRPDDRRHLVAVAVELVERFEACAAPDRRPRRRSSRGNTRAGCGSVVRCRGRPARRDGRRNGLPGHPPVRAAPALDGGAGGARLVAQVVAIAHEGVDGAHGVALLGGQQHERVVEILGAACGPRCGNRRRTAPARASGRPREMPSAPGDPSSSPTRSSLEMAGRRASTS